jgi:hypothetical protein
MVATLTVEAPQREPRVGGLSKVAAVVPAERLAAAPNGSISYIAEQCAFPKPAPGLCYQDEEDVPDPKDGDGIEILDAAVGLTPLYAGVKCFAGMDNDFSARARAVLDAGADRALEALLHTWAAAATETIAGDTLVEKVAAADDLLDSTYIGRGVILMNRGDVVRAKGAAVVELNALTGELATVNGTPVLSTSAVPAGTVHALGSVTVLVQRGRDLPAVINPKTNTEWAIAEDVFAVIVDCNFRATTD